MKLNHNLEFGEVVLTNKGYYIVAKDSLVNKEEVINLQSLDENLCSEGFRIIEVFSTRDGIVSNMLLGLNIDSKYKFTNVFVGDIFLALDSIKNGHTIRSLVSYKTYKHTFIEKGNALGSLGISTEEVEGKWEIHYID